MSLTVALVVGTAACGGASPQAAEPGQAPQTERVHESGRVKLWVPPGWNVDDSHHDSLVMTAPDQAVSIDVTVLGGNDLGAALLEVGAAALIGYDDLVLEGSPVHGEINGMPALFQDGHGKYHGVQVELSVGVIDTPVVLPFVVTTP